MAGKAKQFEHLPVCYPRGFLHCLETADEFSVSNGDKSKKKTNNGCIISWAAELLPRCGSFRYPIRPLTEVGFVNCDRC